ncbi:MAG TPA: hypothetical protein VHE35_19605, partial [Kofleriaceae bacterium]|nr:hypothetical protein [Kofleriaceae bacterium]
WMQVDGGRLRYRATPAAGGDDQLWQVPLAGGAPRLVTAGDPAWLAPAPDDEATSPAADDGRGPVAVALDGAVVTITDASGTVHVAFPPAAGHRWLTRRPVLVGDTIVAATTDADGELSVWRLQRAAAGTPVRLAIAPGAHDPVAVGGRLHVLESDDGGGLTDDAIIDRLVRIDPDGRSSELARAGTGPLTTLAADATGVAYATGGSNGDGGAAPSTIWLADGGAPPRRAADGLTGRVLGLALAPGAIDWIADDGAIWTVPRTGGTPARFHAPAWGNPGGTGPVHLVVDGTSVYLSSVGMGAVGIHRTHGGADDTELWPAPADGLGDELVQVGGALFAIAGRRALWRVPMDGTAPRVLVEAPEGATIAAIAAGGGLLHVAISGSTGTELAAIDPETGVPAATLHTVAAVRALAADETGLDLVLEPGWIVHVPAPPARLRVSR